MNKDTHTHTHVREMWGNYRGMGREGGSDGGKEGRSQGGKEGSVQSETDEINKDVHTMKIR